MPFTDTESAQAEIHMEALRDDAEQRRRLRLTKYSAAAAFAALLYRVRQGRRRS